MRTNRSQDFRRKKIVIPEWNTLLGIPDDSVRAFGCSGGGPSVPLMRASSFHGGGMRKAFKGAIRRVVKEGEPEPEPEPEPGTPQTFCLNNEINTS